MAAPQLSPDSAGWTETISSLHDASRVFGALLKRHRTKRKHWWHASLRPSLFGVTTGVLRGPIDVELELDLCGSLLRLRSSSGEDREEPLRGQSALEISTAVAEFFDSVGFPTDASQYGDHERKDEAQPGYSVEIAASLGDALRFVATQFAELRATFRTEASPIQLWPHHFDLSMLWLPGTLIEGQDPADEEHSDKQLNFGFTFGDGTIDEPYLYVSAYPQPAAFESLELPAGARWQSEGFNGVVVTYATVAKQSNPAEYLQDLWQRCIAMGKAELGTRA